MLTAAFLPMWLRPWASPTEVVDLPSPSGVGVIAVTSDVLAARSLGLEPADRLERDLGLGRAVQLELVVGDAEIAGHVDDRARGDGAGDLQIGSGSSSVSSECGGGLRSGRPPGVRRRG